jgi:hypothetical protein
MKKGVAFVEIMSRLAPFSFEASHFKVVYGDGESIFAVSLANYGNPVDIKTHLPDKDIGHCALMKMCKRGVGPDKIPFGNVGRVGKMVNDRAHSIMAKIQTGMVNCTNLLESKKTDYQLYVVTPQRMSLPGHFYSRNVYMGRGITNKKQYNRLYYFISFVGDPPLLNHIRL